ncbi:UDP-glucose 4-epimerase [Desulfobaculum xiamenense]|uniref:UDP-glucose 4-epimerase n=1 Tax=Desulfobaculum xiamenense TaxID=995050 RepID=A0A846QJY8_9BACT|nr:GDP-mannose 4,6-dehydratase [Desulfobaculum xiamenense]NJB69216.1 UDP-glucose 4-epimerase [Desulfobaculum xiamenense]
MELEGRQCLVTGGAGFIGSHLVDALLERGARVRVLDDFSNGSAENLGTQAGRAGLEIARGSVVDPFDVRRAVDGVQVVFHLACLGVRHSLAHPFANHRVNAEGTLLLLEAARRAGCARFVHCSSSEIYGSARSVPMSEAHSARPRTVYGASKLAGEASARAYHSAYGLPVAVVRPFNAYGPRSHHAGDAGEVIPKSIVRAMAGLDVTVHGDGTQTRDFTYVTDVAEALALAAECDACVGLTLNVGSGREMAIGELCARVVRAVGNPEAVVAHTRERPGDVLRLLADASRFRSLTGWEPKVSFGEGLSRTVEWFARHPAGAEALARQAPERNWEEW